ncbi:flavodoxin family protein [Clostridium tarantellae]|uniref:Flavin reductase n=1 Tax=Clostridium tarantellae TaxID=39493 RepID=A0A6I1MPQ9_9CLOT|nr:NAD(P)H-dependent oxidoreductase [Clostridium tarantellae]MPQ44458.1 flavin reductase [Clostridium tarantellae]
MKITVIYGTMKKGNTYGLAQKFLKELDNDKNKVTEIFLPRDMPNFCRGCLQCLKDKKKCLDYEYVNKALKAMEESDLIIFASPVYVYHVTGGMKNFLDHFAFQWMIHKPNESMFKKQVLILTTAAGAGTKSTIKDISDSMKFWGVSRINKYGVNIRAENLNIIDKKRMINIENDIKKICNKIKNLNGKVKSTLKIKFMFTGIRLMHKKLNISEGDREYWIEKGWLNKKRPWNN